jgi:hypothetical protein
MNVGADGQGTARRVARVEPRTRITTTLMVAAFTVGCSQIIGFKEPRLVSDDDIDASTGSGGSDSSIDTPVSGGSAIWIFVTNAAFDGDFGVPNGGRSGADDKCQLLYMANFTNRNCTHVRAVIQVDNTDDTLERMSIKYTIPAGVEVKRATDEQKVANQWDDVINRTSLLVAPVSTAASSVYFWSGRSMTGNRHCNSWQSKDMSFLGDGGDATKVSSWLSQMTFPCDSITPHVACICW